MHEPADNPGRKSLPHLASFDRVSRSIIQIVSVCVAGRRPLLTNPSSLTLIVSSWTKADYWRVGRYVVMPDHVHLFCSPATFPPTSLKQWVSYWRAEVTRHWPVQSEKPIWQKDFFDRQLRNGESYHEKWNYVFANPVRAGLVTEAKEWPYQGELNVLHWHEPG